ncbi:MAG TPA: hypothetical protein VGX49_06060 [Jatrophihabitans sp.]|jgi:hypothetical protein|nr:hypothetical protein [Jatrophihabitans sp.]
MRAFLSSTLAACAAILLLAPATADAGPATRLKIDHSTSAIFQFDPSIEGNGPLYDAVSATVQLRNCPVGSYSLHMEFVQDGISYELTPGALGRGEINCDATGRAQGGWTFMGNGLHPGPAVVTAWVTGGIVAESSRTVRIPAGYNQP